MKAIYYQARPVGGVHQSLRVDSGRSDDGLDVVVNNETCTLTRGEVDKLRESLTYHLNATETVTVRRSDLRIAVDVLAREPWPTADTERKEAFDRLLRVDQGVMTS